MSDQPRIPPLEPGEVDERIRELLDSVTLTPGATVNIFTTLAHHPRLFRRWLPFGGVLLSGRLPARDRELLILRTGHNCGSPYEWAQHVPLALAAGLTQEEVERVRTGPSADGWDDDDALLLRAADELHEGSTLPDVTWAGLAERYDTEQLIEVPMVVGHYHLVAFTLNSLGVQVEDGHPTTRGGAA